MLKQLSFVLLFASVAFTSQAQDASSIPPVEQVTVIVGPLDKTTDTVIAIPPDTSWSGTISFLKSGTAQKVDPHAVADWLNKKSSTNGLHGTDLQPWHLVVAYDQFDEDGDNVHSGVVEEFWAGPKRYAVRYKSDSLNQTDYATEQGLFRLGDQRWANRTETQVLKEIVYPFSYAASLQGFEVSAIDRSFGPHTLKCFVFQRPGVVSNPTQYCFDQNGSVLRYVRGEGWFQTSYNDVAVFEGRNIGRDVEVTDGGHPFLKLRVKTLELISAIDQQDFTPPPDAVNQSGKPVTGVNPRPISTAFPEWPLSLRGQHFVVVVQITIGKDGHVTDAQVISGPKDARKTAEAAVRKWRYEPYLVAGEPAQVQTKVELTQN